MHHDNGTVELLHILHHLFLHIVKVGYGSQIVILRGIGVETQELYTTGDEREVHSAIHHLVGLVTRSKEVVVADKCHKGRMQSHQDVAAPLKLLSGGRICQISAMHNEINVSAVYIGYLVASVGVP